MTREYGAPGFSVDWLNAWLAAIGVTVLLPQVRLRWTSDPVPSATFVLPATGPDLPELLAGAVPSPDDLAALAIARAVAGRPDLKRNVDIPAYSDRADLARSQRDLTLSATLTDLVAELRADGLPHSPFDPPMPKGITVWERLVACRATVVDVEQHLRDSLAGTAGRVVNNGLGFDARRLVAGVRSSDARVDALVEILAFYGVWLFTVRGSGARARTRGWTAAESRVGAFRWFAWTSALDRWAIDALLDLAHDPGYRPSLGSRLGITRWYQTVPYQRRASMDMTRAYGAEPAR